MYVRKLCLVVASLGLGLALPELGFCKGPTIVTKWGIRFYYADGHKDQSVRDYDSRDEAEIAAENAKQKWNAAFPGDMTKAEPFSYQIRIAPPGRPAPAPVDPIIPVVPRPGGGSSGIVPIPPKVVEVPSLIGLTVTGSENLHGYGALKFRFHLDNRVEMIDARQSVQGSWYQTGNSVTMLFWNGAVTYQGSINGKIISGSANNGRTSWKWSVSR